MVTSLRWQPAALTLFIAAIFVQVFAQKGAVLGLFESLMGKFFGVPEADSGQSQAPYAVFTHEAGQLHCEDRELRHPCVSELKVFLNATNSTEASEAALQCVHGVLNTSEDYWVLKNMTHLLLDLDTNRHVFDKLGRDNEWIMTGVNFAKKLMDHPQCLNDFDVKSELEARCVPLYAKISVLKLKNAGRWDEARALFDKVTGMSWQGEQRTYVSGDAVPWDDFYHTPQIWVRGLRSTQIWERDMWKDLPICSVLEENFDALREETARAMSDEAESGFEDAYRFLYDKGEWNRVLLYHKKEFTEECERVFPKTCAVLKKYLPSKPGLPWTSDQQEQVMVIKMKEGTDVELHSGPSNNILNIHIGISGLEGAKLVVANKTYEWNEGKVIAWDGSFDHSVNCLECKQTRVIMMVRYMHPDMAPHHYKGNKRTHFEDVPLELQ